MTDILIGIVLLALAALYFFWATRLRHDEPIGRMSQMRGILGAMLFFGTGVMFLTGVTHYRSEQEIQEEKIKKTVRKVLNNINMGQYQNVLAYFPHGITRWGYDRDIQMLEETSRFLNIYGVPESREFLCEYTKVGNAASSITDVRVPLYKAESPNDSIQKAEVFFEFTDAGGPSGNFIMVLNVDRKMSIIPSEPSFGK